jgi:hypothetical protein
MPAKSVALAKKRLDAGLAEKGSFDTFPPLAHRMSKSDWNHVGKQRRP